MPARDDGLEVGRHGWRLDALDQWRRQVDNRLAALEGRVSELVINDELAARLTSELRRHSVARFSKGEKVVGALAASLVALCALGGFILQALTAGGHS